MEEKIERRNGGLENLEGRYIPYVTRLDIIHTSACTEKSIEVSR